MRCSKWPPSTLTQSCALLIMFLTIDLTKSWSRLAQNSLITAINSALFLGFFSLIIDVSYAQLQRQGIVQKLLKMIHFRSKFPNAGPFNRCWTISSCKFKDHKDFFIFRKHHFNEVAWFLIQIIARCFSVLHSISRTEPERRDSKNGQKWRRNLNFFKLFFLIIKWWNVSDILIPFSARFGIFLTAK